MNLIEKWRSVGLSNILDSKFYRRKPLERSHWQAVGAAIVDGKLLCKVPKGIKFVAGIEALLIFAVTALHLAVVSWRIRADQLVPDAQLSSGFFKQRR